MPSPKKYKIVLGVTGGIAAYKACEFVRLCRKDGHEVRVVMTKNAQKFVGALSFASLSGNKVIIEHGGEDSDLSATSHIDLAQWGDILVIAPATANFMAKFRVGIADDALLTEALAFQGPCLVAPAMNTRMWQAQIMQENVQALAHRGVNFIGPVSGDLACGETGEGKMKEPAEIYAEILRILERISSSASKILAGRTVLVTSGPTRSYLDPVRFLTNRSSGRMGHAIATAAQEMGANVILVTGPVEEKFAQLSNGKVIRVESSADMAKVANQEFLQADMVFATAAVADFEAQNISDKKLNREGVLDLKLQAASDVIGELGKQKRKDQVFVGFAAETGDGPEQLARGRAKLEKKNLDLLALNNISRSDIGFDARENEVHLLFREDKNTELLQKSDKSTIAKQLVGLAHEIWQEKNRC